MVVGDPFLSSILSFGSKHRLAALALILVCLWLAVLWAVALP